MRHLASELDVSLATVQSVYRQLKNEGHILTRAGDGSFLVRTPEKATKKQFNIVLNYVPPEGALQGSDLGKIYGGMLHASIQQGLQVSFAPLKDLSAPEESLIGMVENQEADGVIIFPTGTEKQLVQCCEERQIPYASLQPASRSSSTNYVSPEHFEEGYVMGRAFAAAQRKRIGFFASGQPTRSTSAWELLSGLTCGMIEDAGEENIVLFTPPAGMPQNPEALNEAIAVWLQRHRDNLPDAIFCHRARYTGTILKTMAEFGLKAPEDFALVTHEDVFAPSPANALATRVGVSFIDIGRALVNMLVERIHSGGQNLPPVRIPVVFGGGLTTSALENEILGVQAEPAHDEHYD
jgi:DNA-binding LacI/PurR family transcriptional regulator